MSVNFRLNGAGNDKKRDGKNVDVLHGGIIVAVLFSQYQARFFEKAVPVRFYTCQVRAALRQFALPVLSLLRHIVGAALLTSNRTRLQSFAPLTTWQQLQRTKRI